MEKYLYNLSIQSYEALIRVFSLFNPKAKNWVEGRKDIFNRLQLTFKDNTAKVAWFHCASLGEFEQGRPLIERFKVEFPHYKILLTFFSPSGYEIRKNYNHADFIFYLPTDSAKNASKFVSITKPSIAFFIKYEFWYHYISYVTNNNIPLISVSAIFRREQIFFKNFGKFYAEMLKSFTHIFVQNEESKVLLQSIGYQRSSAIGDTRFDRVKQIAASANKLPIIEEFAQNLPLLVAGSTWKDDMAVLIPFINTFKKPLKVIIAPHEIDHEEIDTFIEAINKKTVKFSGISIETAAQFDVLIIDNIGMLSSIYGHAQYSFIGGGFGKGIHNILEAIVNEIPVFFGPNYRKFKEANDLIKLQTAFSVKNNEELSSLFEDLYNNREKRAAIGRLNKQYIEQNAGATEKIIEYCKGIIN